MKNLILSALLFFAAAAYAETVTVGVNGMVCSMCAQGISKKFKALKVEELKVDLDNKVVSFSTPEPQQVKDDQIKSLIKEAGYVVTDITRK